MGPFRVPLCIHDTTSGGVLQLFLRKIRRIFQKGARPLYRTDPAIDNGKAFDWGRTSQDYARYRDIYPPAFYQRILDLGLCRNGQEVLDVGTGTGALPRNLCRYGAKWTAADVSPEQIGQAEALSQGMGIRYLVSPAKELDFPQNTFDVVTACQCFWYFDPGRTAPLFRRILKPGGSLLVLYMAWLPFEDPIAGASEALVLKYSPQWSGAGETLRPIPIPERYLEDFTLIHHKEFPLKVHFTRETWHGRMKACRMVDAFLDAGFNYFDTAHGYLNGKSETALRDCLTSRYPRDRYILTDKLTDFFFKKDEDIRPFFESQLAACGVEYFDFYLMHAQNAENYQSFKSCHAYETAFQLKAEGKVRHVGISFHDRPEVLEQILTEYPQVEVVQIQFNYVDYNDPAVQSRNCYEVCRKFGKPVIVMEPVKGGNLVNLPDSAKAVLDALHGGSPASYAIRFAAGFPGMMMVLSGMSDLAQMEDNLSFMKDFQPLNDAELAAVEKVQEIFRGMHLIPCTAGCPRHIAIPDVFAAMNAKQIYHDWNADYYYNNIHTAPGRRASDCIKCGKCEKACPQHLPIRKLLEDVAATFEKK